MLRVLGFFWWWRKQRLDMRDELWQVLGDKLPHQLGLDISVFMGEDVALGDDLSPRDLGMSLLETRADPTRRFADDLDCPLDREL